MGTKNICRVRKYGYKIPMKAFEYEIIPPDSEMIQRMKEENELRRPEMYK